MKRNTFRLVIVLASLCTVGISIMQVYWFRRAFDLEEDQFNREVTASLHNVANRFFEINKAAIPAGNPIKQISTSYYAVMVNNEIDANLLEFLLIDEFEKRNLQLDFEYGIYDCTNDEMVYGNYVSLTNQREEPSAELPKWENQSYYFGVNFPNRNADLISRMDIWLFSSGVLVMVILFFTYTLFVISRQKRLSEIQKDFINNMTHEFKTPISTITVSAGVLKNPLIVKQPERLLNYATIIDNEAKRMRNQVERVLQIAALDNTDIDLKREDIHIHEIIEHVVQTLEASNGDRDIKMTMSFTAERDLVFADRLHLTNVFYNLLDNAIKYSKEPAEITLKTWCIGGILHMAVEDKGIGISQEHIRRIFSRFFRVPTGNLHDVKGFGLGLSYVRLIINALGGEVKAQSTPGEGSTFHVTLPLKGKK
ncbi:MAG: HAMP domain-containing histidine kinase [Cyclobacteriaceae bacterium]|nr:HAMP domain-containing histidine kinase [Cyclobacteriaceae bacterium]